MAETQARSRPCSVAGNKQPASFILWLVIRTRTSRSRPLPSVSHGSLRTEAVAHPQPREARCHPCWRTSG